MIEIQNNKYRKTILAVLFCIVALLLRTPPAYADTPPTVAITVEGKPLEMPVPPMIIADRTLVGVRAVGEAVGGTIEWDPIARTVTVIRGADKVLLTVGDKRVIVNGQASELPVPPQIVNDRTMVPLRFIAEALGGTVEWNADTRTVNILRKPTAITALTSRNDPDKGRLVLTLSEPLLQVTPKTSGNTVTLDLYPAEVKTPQSDWRINDGLFKEVHLAASERTAHLTVQLTSSPNFRYTLSPDGTHLTVEFDHSVTAYQVKQDNRITLVDIGLTGKAAYSSFALDNPPRVVVDVPGARLAPDVPESIAFTNPYITRVRAADRGADGVRLVLDLNAAAAFQVKPTATGLQVQFIPRIESVKTEKLPGKTRITFAGPLPLDAKVTAIPDQRQIKIEVPQGQSALPNNVVKISDGTIDTITVASGAAANSSLITIALPYYVGHTVVSKSGDTSIVVDLITSPIYGKRIWIDAGHGRIPGAKDDPGSIGKTYGTQEKVVNLAVALEVQKRLEAAGAIVYMTRTGDEGVDFTQRPALVNALKPAVDLFVSIHHNSSTTPTVRGSETYYWTTNPKSKVVAQKLHAAVVAGLGFPDRGVRMDNFYVIKETKAPAVLLELGYLSNAVEEKAVGEPGTVPKLYPAKAAEAIKNGIFEYFRLAGN